MGLKKTWNGWVWDDETTTPHTTWASTETTGEPIEIKAPSWQHEQPIVINSPTWEYKPAIPQGWECPKCGRVNAPSVKVCPCSTKTEHITEKKQMESFGKSEIPSYCRTCSNHPSNGGSGICHCILGNIQVTF